MESLVFAKRAAKHIIVNYTETDHPYNIKVDPSLYDGYQKQYKELVLNAIEKEKQRHE